MRLTPRLFLLISFLIALVVGSAVGVTWVYSARIAHDTITDRLVKGDALRASQDDDLYDRLQLVANVFVADANLLAYLAEAQARSDSASILDLLLERQDDLGCDFAMVTDADGYLLARTDRPDAIDDDMAEQPLISLALDEFQSAGLWREGDELHHAVVIPLVQGGIDLLGFFAMGFRLEDEDARESKRLDGADVTVVLLGDTPTVLASSYDDALAPAVGPLLEQMAPAAVSSDPVVEILINEESWLTHQSILRDVDGEPLAVRFSAASLLKETQPFRRITTALGLAGLGTFLIGLMMTWFLARRVTRPLTQLVDAARAARDGEFGFEIPSGSHKDEIGELGQEFDELLGELREKHDMELYVAELSRSLPEPLPAQEKTIHAPHLSLLTLLAAEFRHHAISLSGDPIEELGDLERDLLTSARLVNRAGGTVVAFAGHRLLAYFDGADNSLKALKVALHLAANGNEHGDVPACVVATGDTTLGTLEWQSEPFEAVCGRHVQIIEPLMREASPGEILMPTSTRDVLFSNPAMPNLRLAERQGLATSIGYCVALGSEAAALPAGGLLSESAMESARVMFRPGQVVAERFEILALAGSGAMGSVYRARDRKLGDVVALKTLRADAWQDRTRIELLKKEIKTARQITHPHVLRVYDLGEVDGVPFLSMEYVRGVTLRQLLDRSRRLPYSAALRLARQICLGLEAVHAAGILHHDMKPENVLLEPTGNARLMDFGIARPMTDHSPDAPIKTKTMGTPYYLAPEQLSGGPVDVRADIFGVGVLLFELFTGGRPFRHGQNVIEVLEIKTTEPAKSADEVWPEAPQQLSQLLARCLEKEPKMRFPSMAELLVALERLEKKPKAS